MVIAGSEYYFFIFITSVLGMILFVFYWYKYSAVIRVLSSRRFTTTLIGYHPVKRYVKGICLLLGMICLSLALLRLQLKKDPITVKEEGWNLLIALDVSRSMRTTDIQPSRLSFSKEKIKKLITMLSCTRLSLVLFSSDAFVQCPLTSDKEAFLLFLNQVDSEVISGGSTAIDSALQCSVEALKTVPDKHKMIVFFTDGEDFSTNLESIKDDAKKQNVIVCAVGVGTKEGGPIPVLDYEGTVIGYEKEESGHVAISRLSDDMLEKLTIQCNGLYTRITSDDTDLSSVVSFVNKQEKSNFSDRILTINFDLYPFFLMGGLVCLMLDWIL